MSAWSFLPQEAASRHACVEEIERSVKAEGQVVLGWRNVPVNAGMPMSPTVKAKEPVIRQIFVGRGPDVFVTDALERKLYIIRRRAAQRHQVVEAQARPGILRAVFFCAYGQLQGLLLADQVGVYYA